MQPLWRLSHNLINVQIQFEIILDCNAQYFMSIDWLKDLSVYRQGGWEIGPRLYEKAKSSSCTILFVAAQVLMLSSSDYKIDTPRAAANFDIVMSSTYFQYEQRGEAKIKSLIIITKSIGPSLVVGDTGVVKVLSVECC